MLLQRFLILLLMILTFGDFMIICGLNLCPIMELHLIPVVFVAGDDPGEVYQKIQIETDLIDCAQELSAYAEIISQ